MSDGWKCPGCGRCFAPTVRECDGCNSRVVSFKPPIFPPEKEVPRCLACGNYHPQGLACPTMTVKP